jgi:hypothetical protein
VQEPKPLCVQLKVQPPKSLTVWLTAGLVAVQNVSATIVPTSFWQVTSRVCAKVAVQAEPAAGVKAPLTHAYTWPMPERLKLLGLPESVVMLTVAASAPTIEGLKVTAPLVQVWPALKVVFAQVPDPRAKSALLLENGVAPKMTVFPTAVKVTVPQVTARPSAVFAQLGGEPTEIVPAPAPLARKFPLVPNPALGDIVTPALRLPKAVGVKEATPEVQVLPAPIVALAHVPLGIVKSEPFVNTVAPKLTGPPEAVTVTEPHVEVAPILVVGQLSVAALTVPQLLESATDWLEAGVAPVQLVLATVAKLVPLYC